jgi:AraC-like DNA-binding protein/TolB-like protein
MSEMSQRFLDKLEQIVQDNLSNEQFGVEDLAKHVSLSRFQIHRKLQASTGQSISQFIREIRLRKAYELLMEGNLSASEVSYRVGFGSPAYFSKCFVEYYKITPGEVKKNESAVDLVFVEEDIRIPQPKNDDQQSKRWSEIGQEIIKRQIPRVTLVYLLISWLVLQIISLSNEYTSISSSFYSSVLILLCCIFPIAIYFAWHYENTSKGFVKTSRIESADVKVLRKPLTRSLVFLIMLIIITFTYLIPKKGGESDLKSNSMRLYGNNTLAVLPFEILNNAEENEYLVRGIKEAIEYNLAGLSELIMPSPNATLQYNRTTKPIDEIAGELEVRYLLYGSLLVFKDTFRIMAKIYDQNLDKTIWQNPYTEPENNFLSVVDKVALAVKSNVHSYISPVGQLEEQITEDYRAMDLYMRGRHFYENYLNEWDDEDLSFAEDFYNEALKSDNSFALAYVGLGNVARLKSRRFGIKNRKNNNHAEYEDSMKLFISKAINADPLLAEAHLLKADLFYYQDHFDSALYSLDKVINLKKNFSDAYYLRGRIWLDQMNFPQALKNLRIAEYFEKSGTQAQNILYNKSLVYTCIGDNHKAINNIRKAAQLTPGTSLYFRPYVYSFTATGNFETAENLLDSGSQLFGEELDFHYAMLYTWTNRPKEALEKLTGSANIDVDKELGLLKDGKSNLDHLAAYNLSKLGYQELADQVFKSWIDDLEDLNRINLLAEVYAEMGEYEKAMENLIKLEAENPYDELFELSKHIPSFEPLRDDPGYIRLIAMVDQQKALVRQKISEIEAIPIMELIHDQ